MTQTSLDLLLLFSGACGLLVLASLIGEVLRLRLSSDIPHPTVETYMTRVNSWWAMVFLLTGALLLGRAGVILLFACASFCALREFLTLTTKTRGDHWSLIASFYLILPLQYLLVWTDQYGIFAILIPVYAFLLLPILSALRGPTGKFLARISETQWALMICVYCASHVPALLTLQIADHSGRNVLLIAFLVLVVQLGDLMDYFAGRRIGKRKIAPSISPKTWEGLGCAAGFAAGLGFLLSWITPFGPWMAPLMAMAAFLVGVGGSLVLKAIKRDLGVKDWGHLIPGQGGFVDQMDSVVFAAPIFFHLTRYFWSV